MLGWGMERMFSDEPTQEEDMQVSSGAELIERTHSLIDMYEQAGVPNDDPLSPEVITYNSLIEHRNNLQAQLGVE